jgi:hypothetical protein
MFQKWQKEMYCLLISGHLLKISVPAMIAIASRRLTLHQKQLCKSWIKDPVTVVKWSHLCQ